ncbi:MAG: hypothetical protein ABIB71_03330 [Candidatus Woesearchaeota archaeon]
MVAVHLNKGEDDFLSGYSKLETPDEKIEHKVEGSLLFEGHEELVKKYGEILAIGDWYTLTTQKILAGVRSSLTPDQINSFLQTTTPYDNHKNYCDRTGRFITRLIQNSHDTGNNLFKLETRTLSKGIYFLGYNLQGKGNNLLEIIVDGNAKYWCGVQAKNCTFKTPNKETLRQLKENVPKDKGNKIYFIKGNKEERIL